MRTHADAMRTSAGVTYLFGDHLGLTSAAIDPNGQLTKQGYYAFGGVRYNVGALPTDYTFTGQKNDASDGLLFYNARYYDAALGRFIQPDSLILNFYNPQDLNRYTYVRNNPVRHNDPTGHMLVDPGGGVEPAPPANTPTEAKPLVSFDQDEGQTWTKKEKETIEDAADDVARKLAKTINRRNRLAWKTGEYEGIAPPKTVTPQEAFYSAYGGPVTFKRVNEKCTSGCFGEVLAPNLIVVYSNATAKNVDGNNRFIVHELGHAFDNNIGNQGRGLLDREEIRNDEGKHVTGYDPSLKRFDRKDLGYIKGDYPWEQHPTYLNNGNTAMEDFADMFLNWVYNSFDYGKGSLGAGKARYNWMDPNMGIWLK